MGANRAVQALSVLVCALHCYGCRSSPARLPCEPLECAPLAQRCRWGLQSPALVHGCTLEAMADRPAVPALLPAAAAAATVAATPSLVLVLPHQPSHAMRNTP